MRLVLRKDWWLIVRRAWSVRIMALAGVLSGLAAGLTIAQPYLGVNPLLIAGVVGVATCGACFVGIYARVVHQRGIK